MRDFYAARRNRPFTTADLEAFLLARSGRPDIVDAFHRFAHGLPDPSPLPDLWLRDEVGDPGANDWAGRFWDSPDLWVRREDDGGLTHQNPEFGQDNWIHARVRNRSATATARHLAISFNHRGWAGTQFSYPADFLPAFAAATAFDLAPGETRIVKARWPRADVPPVGSHPCLLAAVYARFDQPIAGLHVWEQNNLAQKNLTVVDLAPNTFFVLPVLVRNLRAKLARSIDLQLVRPAQALTLPADLLLDAAFQPTATRRMASHDEVPIEALAALDCGCADPQPAQASATTLSDSAVMPFKPGGVASLPLRLKPLENLRVGLRVGLPSDAKPGASYTVDLVQRENGKVVGGVALTIRAK